MTNSAQAAAASRRALSFLSKISKRHEGIWQQVDGLREYAHQEGVRWDRRCFIPGQFLRLEFDDPFPCRGRYNRPSKLEQKKRLRDSNIIAGLASWRLTRGIFVLSEQDVADAREIGVPKDPDPKIFLHLPLPCVYVPTPGFSWLGDPLSGFFAYLDAQGDELDLILLMDRDEPVFHSLTDVIQVRIEYQIHKVKEPMTSRADIIRNWTKGAISWGLDHEERNLFQATALGDYWKRPLQPGEKQRHPDELLDALKSCLEEDIQPIAGLLYRLCEVTAQTPPKNRPATPKPKRTTNGFQMIPAEEVDVWDVDTRTRQLRQQLSLSGGESEGTVGSSGHRKRTHARISHIRKLQNGQQKWIPASIINANDSLPDDRPVTVTIIKRD